MDKVLEDFIAIEGNKAILESYVKTKIEEAMEEKKGSFQEQLEAVEERGYQRGFKVGVKSKDKTDSKEEQKEPVCFKKYPKSTKDITGQGCRKCSFHKKCKGT